MTGFDKSERRRLTARPVGSLMGMILMDTWVAGLDSLLKNQVRETRPTIHIMYGSLVAVLHIIVDLLSNGREIPHSLSNGSLSNAYVYIDGFS